MDAIGPSRKLSTCASTTQVGANGHQTAFAEPTRCPASSAKFVPPAGTEHGSALMRAAIEELAASLTDEDIKRITSPSSFDTGG